MTQQTISPDRPSPAEARLCQWSVMIPAYRPQAGYLRKTLESVLQQDPGPGQMQIEVVDDCSPDLDVEAIVRSVSATRVGFSRTPKNLGIAGCWNTCIERARGQLVHILHQDDLVMPGFYEALRPAFSLHENVGAAFSRFAFMDENDHWQSLSTLEAPVAGILPDWLARITSFNRLQCPAIVVRRHVYEEIGRFRQDLPHTLDWEMWIRIASRYAIYFDPRLLACFRRHSQSTTRRQEQTGEALRDTFHCIKIWSAYLKPRDVVRQVRAARRLYAEAGLGVAQRLVQERNFSAARRNCCIAVANCPHPMVLQRAARILLGLTWQ